VSKWCRLKIIFAIFLVLYFTHTACVLYTCMRWLWLNRIPETSPVSARTTYTGGCWVAQNGRASAVSRTNVLRQCPRHWRGSGTTAVSLRGAWLASTVSAYGISFLCSQHPTLEVRGHSVKMNYHASGIIAPQSFSLSGMHSRGLYVLLALISLFFNYPINKEISGTTEPIFTIW